MTYVPSAMQRPEGHGYLCALRPRVRGRMRSAVVIWIDGGPIVTPTLREAVRISHEILSAALGGEAVEN